MSGSKIKASGVETVGDFQEASTLWVDAINQLNDAEQALKAVDSRLKSFGLTIIDNLGMSKSLSDAEIRSASLDTINKMSRRDLIRKREYLLDNIAQLQHNIDLLNEKRNNFRQQEYLQKQTIQHQFDAQQQQQQRQRYRQDPKSFFESVLIDLPPQDPKVVLSPTVAEKLYAAATQIAAASAEFNFVENPAQVLAAWNIVDRAREEALRQLKELGTQQNQDQVLAEKAYTTNIAMFNNSQLMFSNIINTLPSGMQGLLLIYSSRDYAKTNQYLNKIAKITNEQEWTALALELSEDIRKTTEANARTILSAMANFKTLPVEIQDELVRQKAYTMRLAYDLSFVASGTTKIQALDELKRYAAQLDVNIQNAIANYRSLTQCEADFMRIKQQLDKREHEIRNYYFKKQLTDRPEFALGVGLGTAWIFGIGIPATAMVIVGVTILKAHLESSPLRLRIDDIDSSRNLVDLVNPVDYEFIQKMDSLWGRGTNIPIEQTRVNIRYVSDDVHSASLRGAQKAVDAIHRSMFAPILAVYAMQMFASTLFFIAAGMTLPFVWPLFAAMGTAAALGLTYVAGKSIVENVDLPNTRIYKAANAIVKAIDFAIVRPVKFIYNAIKGLFYKPEQHAFDMPTQEPDFTLSPELRIAIDRLYPGLANKFVEHFQHRYASILQRIEQARAINDVSYGIELQQERAQLIKNWQTIIAAVSDKQQFLQVTAKFVDRSYELERKEFVRAAIKAKENSVVIAQEVSAEELAKTGTPVETAVRNTLLFNKDSIAPEKIEFARDYVQERQNVQEICELKSILAKLGKS